MSRAKRILSLIFTVCILMSLFGCGSSDEWEEYSYYEDVPTSSSGGEALTSSGGKKVVKKKKVTGKEQVSEGLINSDELSLQEQLFAKSSLNGTKLTYVKGSEDVYPQEEYAIKQLKEKWGIECNYVVYSNSSLPSMVATMVASGNPPDVAHVADTNLIRYAYSNLAVALDDYLVLDDPVWDKSEGTFDIFTFGGKIYGIPWGTAEHSIYWVWYNKTYLKEVGAEDPYELYKAGKWDVEAFKRVAKQAVQYESDGKTVKTYGATCWNPSVFLALYGETGVAEQSGGKWKVTMDSTAGMKGLQLIRDMSANNSLNLAASGKTFGTRGTAMVLERDKNAIGQYDYYNTMEDEIGMVPLPSTSYGSFAYKNTDGSFVLKGSKNPMAAVAYRYYDRLFVYHSSDEEKKAAGYDVTSNINMSADHAVIAKDYLNNKCAKIIDDKLYALTNWQTGEKLGGAFWTALTKEGKQPAQLIDSTKSQLTACLKDTVGASNVVN